MKEFFFISGLPRSGSTLLSAILRQNPEFYADISSPVQSLVASTINVITGSESNHLIDEERRKSILRSLFNAYYESVSPKTVFDTSRSWTSKHHCSRNSTHRPRLFVVCVTCLGYLIALSVLHPRTLCMAQA